MLDASALLAVLRDEPGGEMVAPLLDGAIVSTVNWSEVLDRYADLGVAVAGREAEIESLGVSLAPFTSRQAEVAAGLLPLTREAGLSLGDRACLALALDLGGRPVTADRAWARIDVGVTVTLIR
ncbi:MAG: PIN domain nuclease [Pseudonocardiales bacterium]|nr:MAG: PIN domain nuclease [Pseudonocardiales bacterium]